MNKIGCNCLPLILLFLTFFVLLKFWFVFFLIIFLPIIFLANKGLLKNLKSVFKKENQFKSKPGIVYKECSFCDAKAERFETVCKNCKRPFN